MLFEESIDQTKFQTHWKEYIQSLFNEMSEADHLAIKGKLFILLDRPDVSLEFFMKAWKVSHDEKEDFYPYLAKAINFPLKSQIDIFQKMLKGDQMALKELLLFYHNYLVVVGLRYLSDRQRVEDAIHDVFTDLWNTHKEIQIHSGVKSFLRGAVVNKCLAIIRKDGRITLVEDHDYGLSDNSASADQILDRDNLQSAVDEIIRNLPQKCSQVFFLSRIEGLSQNEIAEKLGISKKTIENHMTKALKTIRMELKRKEFLIIIFIFLKFDLLLGAWTCL